MTFCRLCLTAATLALLASSCDHKTGAGAAAQPAPSTHSPSIPDQAPPPLASSAPSAVASAPLVMAPADPIQALFHGAPAPDTRRSETITAAGGVYAGLPPEWSTQDVYNEYLIASTKQAKAMVYLVVGGTLAHDQLEAFAKGAAYPIYLKSIDWDSPWVDVTVGAQGYVGKARRGHGASIYSATTRRAAVVVGIEVPDRKNIFVLGSWDEPAPEVEKQFGEIVRGIGRCKHKPKRGCVPVMPSGAEDELPDPPRAGPGSSPFG